MNVLNAFFSPEKRAARLEARLQRAILANDQQKTASLFCKSFVLLLKKERSQLLSDLRPGGSTLLLRR